MWNSTLRSDMAVFWKLLVRLDIEGKLSMPENETLNGHSHVQNSHLIDSKLVI